MADNWNDIGDLAKRIYEAPLPVKNAYSAFIASSDGTYETDDNIKLLTNLLKDAFKMDFNSRQMVAMRHQQLEFQNLPSVIPPPEEIFNEPDSGMKITIESKPVQKEQKVQEQVQEPTSVPITVPVSVLKPVKKPFEEIYEDNIEEVCRKHNKDLETAYKIINDNCNRPYTMLCNYTNNCNKKQFCWFAHSKKEQDDANNAYIKTLKDYYSDNPKYIEFINGLNKLFGKDWEAYGLMLSCHKNGRIPYALCNFGNKCVNKHCTYYHNQDNKSRFFKEHGNIFKDIQLVKQPEE